MKNLALFFHLLFNVNFVINVSLGLIFITASFILSKKMFQMHFSKKQEIIYILSNAAAFCLTATLTNYIYAPIATCIFSILFSICLLRMDKWQVFSCFCLKTIVLLNIQFLVFKTMSVILSEKSYVDIRQSPILGIVSIFLMLIFEAIFYVCSKHIKFDKLLEASINKKSTLVISVSSLNLAIIFLVSFIFFEKISQNIFYLFILDLYFYFSTLTVIHTCQISYAKQKIENLKICNKTILSIHDDIRAFKHDFHNIIQAIGGYVWTNDMEGLKKYYKQISNDCINTNNLSKLNPTLINNPAIYNLLANKYTIANNNHIQINLDIMLDLNELNIQIYELTRILGILLDNAIEASKECNEKNINISFKQDKYKQMLVIENTYNDKQISIEKIFEKDYSTKPHNTGLGLWEVRKILNKNSNLNLHTSKNNDYFSQQLEIYSV